jgi:hypothetical protein
MPKQIADLTYPAKPPRYWLEAKQRTGLSLAACGRIWFRNYTDTKRIAAWLVASDEEWVEHGLKRPVR